MMNGVPIVLPARVSGGGVTMQTTTSRLSAEGMFVRSLLPPKEGASVSVQLMLPGVARPVEFKGTVSERILSGKVAREAGFIMRFGDLSREASDHLDVLLRSRGQAGVPAAMRPQREAVVPAAVRPQGEAGADPGRRAFPRVQMRFRVGWTTSRDFLDAVSENISRGGIFVATPTPPELQETVELLLALPDGLAPARLQAEVVQRTTPEEAKRSGRSAGMGLQFIGADDDFQSRLDNCIEGLS